ncbi:hypothetical protein ACFQ0B_76740 [Nonomuraea thailandensis]
MEGFLPARQRDTVHCLARIRQAEDEQVADRRLAGQVDDDVAEVDLGVDAGPVFLVDGDFPRGRPACTRISGRRQAT